MPQHEYFIKCYLSHGVYLSCYFRKGIGIGIDSVVLCGSNVEVQSRTWYYFYIEIYFVLKNDVEFQVENIVAESGCGKPLRGYLVYFYSGY